MPRLSTANYRALAAFRHEIRKFLAFSEHAAREAGVEPQQHQLLLAVRGLPEGMRPTIGVIAERLCVRHHTAVALVDKLESNGLILRERSSRDRREVLLVLTAEGEALLRTLSSLHQAQLLTAGPQVIRALQKILDSPSKLDAAQTARSSSDGIASDGSSSGRADFARDPKGTGRRGVARN